MQQLKRQGVIRHIGLSSHTPSVVQKVLDLHLLDMLMFSINPAYDYRHGEYAYGSGDERAALYRRSPAKTGPAAGQVRFSSCRAPHFLQTKKDRTFHWEDPVLLVGAGGFEPPKH